MDSLISPVEKVPTTETLKNMYPLYDNDNNFSAWITILLKVTCFGKSITQTIVVAPDLLSPKDEMPQPVIMSPQKLTVTESLESAARSCAATQRSSADKISSSSDSMDSCHALCKAALYPSPAESCTQLPGVDNNYEEYRAEINGNALIVRVAKNARLTTEIVGDDRNWCEDEKAAVLASFLKSTFDKFVENYCSERQVKHKHRRRTPAVRGNLKYPNILLPCGVPRNTNTCCVFNDEELLAKIRVGNETKRNVSAQIYASEIDKSHAAPARPTLHMQKVVTSSAAAVPNGLNGTSMRKSLGGNLPNSMNTMIAEGKCPPGLEVSQFLLNFKIFV